MRCALVGFGQIAEKAHLPAFKEKGVDIVAVAEAHSGRAAAARSAVPHARVYDSYDRLLESEKDLDFVDIATPPFLHAAQVSAALSRGFSCLCEKPLAVSLEDLETVRRAATASGKT